MWFDESFLWSSQRNKPFSPAASSQNTKVWHRSWMAEIGTKFSKILQNSPKFLNGRDWSKILLLNKIVHIIRRLNTKNTNIVFFFFDSAFQNEFYSYPWAVRAQQRCDRSCAEKQGNPKSEKETYPCDPIRLWEWLLRFIGPLGSLGPDYPHNLNIISTSSSWSPMHGGFCTSKLKSSFILNSSGVWCLFEYEIFIKWNRGKLWSTAIWKIFPLKINLGWK